MMVKSVSENHSKPRGKHPPLRTKYGYLCVISVCEILPPDYRVYYICQCDCGRIVRIRSDALKCGLTKSCAQTGCYRANISAKKRTKHGLSSHPLYGLWCEMIRRCHNPKAPNYNTYGGRGISVCVRWHDFNNFLYDVPERPSKAHSLDRIDNDMGYQPDNVRWATPKVQGMNRRNVHHIIIDDRVYSMNSARKLLGMKNDGPIRAIMKNKNCSAQAAFDNWITLNNR